MNLNFVPCDTVLRDFVAFLLLCAVILLVHSLEPSASPEQIEEAIASEHGPPAFMLQGMTHGLGEAEQHVAEVQTNVVVNDKRESKDLAQKEERPSPPALTGQIGEAEPLGIIVEPPEDEPLPEVPQRIEFFESETVALSVCYVVDCSGSMDGRKMEQVKAELAESIAQLLPNQRFFVVFFSDSVQATFGGGLSPQLVEASLVSKQQALQVVFNVSSQGGTLPESAVRLAASLRPEVMYLLTDGVFEPLQEETYSELATAGVAVHTIGFETTGTDLLLKDIASRTGGSYRAAVGSTSVSLMSMPPEKVIAALGDGDSAKRRQALVAAILRQIPIEGVLLRLLVDPDDGVRLEALSEAMRRNMPLDKECIQLLRDTNDEIAGRARGWLVRNSGIDFGVYPNADLDGAIRNWEAWWAIRDAANDNLVGLLQSSDQMKRWVAAARLRGDLSPYLSDIISAMTSSELVVCLELRRILREAARGVDFGPAGNASAAEVVVAAGEWKIWHERELARIAEEERAQRVSRAKELLRLARLLINRNPAAVRRRCEVIIRDFGDTPAADEAKQLIEELAAQQ